MESTDDEAPDDAPWCSKCGDTGIEEWWYGDEERWRYCACIAGRRLAEDNAQEDWPDDDA